MLPLPDEKVKCPHSGFTRSCRDIVIECACPKFVKVSGKNKNTDELIDKWGCIDSILHIIQMETHDLLRKIDGEISEHRKENLDQGLRIMENQKAIDANLITMHGQNAQIALAQIRSNVAQLNNEPELPFLEHQGNA
jgi:hypothetical protein